MVYALSKFGHKSMSQGSRPKTRIHLDALARAELAYSFCREAAELAHLERFEEAEEMAARSSSSHVSRAPVVTTRGIMELWDEDLTMICMHRCPSMSIDCHARQPRLVPPFPTTSYHLAICAISFLLSLLALVAYHASHRVRYLSSR
jgi:hypothetical protein